MQGYIEKIKDGYSFKSFMFRRASRLLPLVAIAAVVYSVADGVYYQIYGSWFQGWPVTFWGILNSMFGIQDGWAILNPKVNNPTWYISVLFLCYIVFFIAIWISKRCRIPCHYLFACIVFLGIGIRSYAINLPFLNADSARGYYAFFCGVLLGMWCRKYQANQKKELAYCLIPIVICLVIAICKAPSFFLEDAYVLTFVLYPMLIIIMDLDIMKKVFHFKWIGELGRISFNMYIWHATLLVCLFIVNEAFHLQLNYSSVWAMAGFTFVTFVLSCISYYLIEKNVLKWMNRQVVL